MIGLLYAAAALAASVQSGSYTGGTSQGGGSVSFTVSNGGGSVEDFKAEMSATCIKGSASQSLEVTLSPTPNIKLRQGGFDFSGGFVFRNGDIPIGHGKGNVSGDFSSDHRVTGTFRFPWEFFSNAGLLSGYHCDTGKVTFQGTLVTGASASAGCVVPKLKGKKLKAAKRAIRKANCRVGRVVKHSSAKVKRRHVIGQRPRPKTVHEVGAPVKIIVSRGPANKGRA
ncbi:MAG TPA: PASTA domain-containing protein [Solirubrobacterales bacterium]